MQRILTPIFSAMALAAGSAHADQARFQLTNKAYVEECGACHVAFPPPLLPADAWRSVMQSLDRHFDADASLDPDAIEKLTSYLVANAGHRKATRLDGTSLPRITETSWFKREHDEIPTRVWKTEPIKRAANCAACHQQAETGDFSERTLHVPR